MCNLPGKAKQQRHTFCSLLNWRSCPTHWGVLLLGIRAGSITTSTGGMDGQATETSVAQALFLYSGFPAGLVWKDLLTEGFALSLGHVFTPS